MVKASHPNAGYFSEYIYTIDPQLANNKLDIFLENGCNDKSVDGFICEGCYTTMLDRQMYFNNSYIGLKKFFTYQIGLYDNPNQWLKEFKRWMNHSDADFNYKLENLINEVIDDIIKVESQQADLPTFLNITNHFVNSTIQQVNQGGNNTLTINYSSVLEEMKADGVPNDIINEGAELFKDANKSNSLKTIAANWIKNLPFKMMEKAGSWSIENYSKLEQYQNDLMTWINNL
jgi:hypothetical protein